MILSDNAESFGFRPEHAKYLLDRSIPLALAHSIGARSMTRQEVALILNRQADSLPSGGLSLEYPQSPGFWRVRMDNAERGKFLTRQGLPVLPYVPPPSISPSAAWMDPAVEVTLVEGPWKAIALCAAGFLTIGLAGCNAGGHDAEKKKRNRPTGDVCRVS